MMKNKERINNMQELELEIHRIRLEMEVTAGKIEEQFQYGRRHILAMSINSIFCKKVNKPDQRYSFFNQAYKKMAVQRLNSLWEFIIGQTARKNDTY